MLTTMCCETLHTANLYTTGDVGSESLPHESFATDDPTWQLVTVFVIEKLSPAEGKGVSSPRLGVTDLPSKIKSSLGASTDL